MTTSLTGALDDFLQSRNGSVGGSNVGDALSTLKKASGGRVPGDPTQASISLQYELAAQRITGYHPYANPLQWGNEHEDESRAVYALTTNLPVVHLNLDGSRIVIPHPTIKWTHASPDALVGEEGGVELKNPTSAIHLRTLLTGVIPEEYLPQIHWNLACSGRQWWDFCSHDPRFPSEMQCFIRRVRRDPARIAEMEEGVKKFLATVNEKVDRAMREFSL